MNTLRHIAAPIAMMTAMVALATHAADRQETRDVHGFTGVALAAPIKVELVQGDTESLVLEGDEAALAELETFVEDGMLRIRTRSRHEPPGMGKVRARVGAKTIESLRIAGSGDIDAASLRAKGLKLAISGSGDMRLPALAVSSLDVSIAGSGDIVAGGKVDALTTSIAGSGDLKATKLDAGEVTVHIAGSGDVAVWARKSLGVKIVGSGDVRYYGDPAVTRTILGSGSLTRVGASPS
ncbi:MAG: head GIN domain-containing protein [Usitatibacter sp.]